MRDDIFPDLKRLIFIMLSLIILIHPGTADDTVTQITVVTDDHYPPFTFLDSHGNIQGIAIDQWKLFEEKTGIQVNITGLPWDEAQNELLAGSYDVIETLGYSSERAQYYDFSPSYATVDVPIFFERNIPGISGPESLGGYVVAVQKGDSVIDILRSRGVTTIREYPGYEEIIQDAKAGNVHVFSMDKPAALYLLHKYNIADSFMFSEPLYSTAVHRAVKKGNPLLSVIDEGFSKISPAEYETIERKWYGTPVVETRYLEYFFIFLGLFLLCGGILFSWNLILNKKVKTKTEELVREIDISNSRARELEENRQFLRNIFENIPDMIFIKEASDLRFVNFNKAGETLLGYDRSNLIGKNDYDFFPKNEADFFTAKDRQVIDNKCLVDIPEETIQTKDHGQRILHTKKIPILDSDGKPLYLLGISEDITEQKRSENALIRVNNLLQTIYDGSPDLIYLHNTQGRIIEVNENVTKRLGFTRDEIFKSEMEDISGEGYTSEMAFENINEALKTGSIDFEWVIKTKDGVEFPAEVRLRKLESVSPEGMNEVFILAIVRDITVKKHIEVSLQRATKKLNLLDSIAFNDINNATFCLVGYLDLLKSEVKDESVNKYLKHLEGIFQTIEGALTFAHNYQSLGLNPAKWQNVQQAFLFGISHLDLSSYSRDADVTDLEVYADPLLEMVFFSLAKNVQMHAECATRIMLRYEEEPDGITIFFEDNGRGIPPNQKDSIFERKSSVREGMGLFLTREILEITGITLKETGEYQSGARFEIFVPKGGYRFVPDVEEE